MPQMKARQLRDRTIDELLDQEKTLREQIFKLRFQRTTGQVENPARARLARRELARVLTVIREKTAAGSPREN